MIRSSAAGGREEESPPRPDLSRVILATLAGPALIVSSVLFQLRGFAFGGLISLQHKDVVAFWLPTYCLMGKTVSAGDVPGWNPYVMTGVPLAADPQSGWMSIIPMVLFPTTSCGTAIRWLIVVLPILAGLGLFAFLRSEGLSRIAGTVGGLSLAMTMASSRLGLSVPFAMAIAWSAVALWAASRLVRAVDRPSRFAWIAATSLAWGQIVAAHPSNGQLIGSGALACFLLAKGIVLVRDRGIGLRSLLVVLALLGASMIAVNLAILLPRGAYLGRTGLSLGYDTLGDGTLGVSAEGLAIGASWPLKLSVVPGAYLGSIVLALAGAGLWSARWRHLAIAFAAFATVYYLLSLDVVYRLLAPIVDNVPMADQLYLHQPWRFGLALILALPILGALGVESWLRAHRESGLVRLWMVVPGVVVWVMGTALVAPADGLALFAAGLVVCGGSLLLLSRRPPLLGFVPFLLAVELLVNGAVGLSSSSRPSDLGSDVYAARFLYGPLLRPTIPARRYLTEPAFVDPIRAADRRYVTFGRYHQSAPRFWPALGDQRGIVFGIEDANGYNPAQPIRFWRFNRAINRASGMPLGKYNVSALRALAPSAIDLLDVGWVISRKKAPAESWVSPVAEDRGWVLSTIEPSRSRASIPERWVVLSEPEALRRVSDPTFDPALTLVLEADPGVSRGRVQGARADFEWTGLASARVAVSTTADAVVLIRNGYDPYWHATLDGRETPILVGDYFLQAVPVPAGSHTIELRYRDPWVGLGASGSTLTLVVLFGLTLGLRRRTSQAT